MGMEYVKFCVTFLVEVNIGPDKFKGRSLLRKLVSFITLPISSNETDKFHLCFSKRAFGKIFSSPFTPRTANCCSVLLPAASRSSLVLFLETSMILVSLCLISGKLGGFKTGCSTACCCGSSGCFSGLCGVA